MAKLSEKKTLLKTETHHFLGQDFKLKFFVLRDGRFQVSVPPAVAQATHLEFLTADTLAKLETQLKELKVKFRESHATYKKVIYYRFSGHGLITRPNSPEPIPPYRETGPILGVPSDDEEISYRMEGPSTQVLWRAEDISFADTLTVAITAFVAREECLTLPDGKFLYSYRAVPSTIPESLRNSYRESLLGCKSRPSGIVDWTQELEDFFASIGLAFEGLILKLETLKDKKSLALAVENRLLLEGTADGHSGNKTEHSERDSLPESG